MPGEVQKPSETAKFLAGLVGRGVLTSVGQKHIWSLPSFLQPKCRPFSFLAAMKDEETSWLEELLGFSLNGESSNGRFLDPVPCNFSSIKNRVGNK